MEIISNQKQKLKTQSNSIAPDLQPLLNHKDKEETKNPNKKKGDLFASPTIKEETKKSCNQMFLVKFGIALGNDEEIYRLGYN